MVVELETGLGTIEKIKGLSLSDELILKPQIAPHPNGIGRTLQLQPLPQHPTPQPTVFHPDGILFGLTHLE